MRPLIHDHFLLTNRTAERLYHQYAQPLPIIDFHNHLAPKDIAGDRVFDSMTALWLEGDHYKWRVMRACGVNEHFITGKADDWEKFKKWAETVPRILGNPLYHWTHLELKRYFGIDELLNPSTARKIFDACNKSVRNPDYSVKNLLRRMNVEYLCTMEDPADLLSCHYHLKNDFETQVSAGFRFDKALNIMDGRAFVKYLDTLARICGFDISNYQQLCAAIEQRHDFFHQFGARQADVALDLFKFADVDETEADEVFKKALTGKQVSLPEADSFRTVLLLYICTLNHQKGWAQQFHLGALRNVNTRGTVALGEATGFDCISDVSLVSEFGKFLDTLELRGHLAKSIVFNLNPRDNAAILALINSFNDGLMPGKMQYGPAWWFLDHKKGIEQHLSDLAAHGVLGNFIGMLTDSRSFLSFSRHEYFRRILCNILGREVEEGLVPDDEALLRNTVERICYYNAKEYLCLP